MPVTHPARIRQPSPDLRRRLDGGFDLVDGGRAATGVGPGPFPVEPCHERQDAAEAAHPVVNRLLITPGKEVAPREPDSGPPPNPGTGNGAASQAFIPSQSW